MRGTATPLTDSDGWRTLEHHFEEVRSVHLREFFAQDPDRGERLALEAEGLFLDYSKNRVTGETLELLLRLAEERGLRRRIDAMFAGEHVNVTEDRAVLHVALRAPRGCDYARDEVFEVLDRMANFSEHVRSGQWTGHTGRRTRN